MLVSKVNSTKTVTKAVVEAVNPRKWANIAMEEKVLNDEMLKNSPKAVKFLDKAKNFVGEVPNILINAVGTGLVAPVFIKHNFLSKADDDTRTYSAWRQPVSAVLAVLTQAGLVIPFNKVINKMTNSGEFKEGNCNKKAYQDLDYIEKQIKKENKNLTKEEVKKLAKEKQFTQLQDIIEELYTKDNISYKGKNGIVNLDKKELSEMMEKTVDKMGENIKEGSKEAKVLAEMKEAIKNKKSMKEIYKISQKIGGQQEGKFVYDVAQKYISNVEASIKGSKQLTGLLVSLAILPVTCSLLNWVYPKFMDAFFPELSSKKPKPKTPDTFEKSTQQVKEDK